MLKFGFSSLILVNPAAPNRDAGRVVVGTRPQEGPAQFRVHQEFVASALAHDPAVGQKIGRPGGGEGPGGVLLHQEDGHPAPGKLLDDVEDLVGDQRRQPQGGSSRSNSRGWAIRARPMATICCSPPERVLVRWPARSLSLGNRAETAVQAPGHLAAGLSSRPGPPAPGSP